MACLSSSLIPHPSSLSSVLVIAPHPDDEAIGCGGTICLHRLRGHAVRVVFLTSGGRGLPGVPEPETCALREQEAAAAAQVLGVQQLDFLRLPDGALASSLDLGAAQLGWLLYAGMPQLIYLPHPQDEHPDHAASLALVRAALLSCAGQGPWPRLLGYEVWTPMSRYHVVEDVSPVMGQKLRAIHCYPSQLQLVRYDQAQRGLNRYRGRMTTGKAYAEVFQELSPSSEAHEVQP